MKVLSLAADEGGCGYYRVRAPAYEIGKLGVDITVADGIDVISEKNLSTGMVTVHEVQTDADLITVQRPLDNGLNAMIRQAQKQGIAVVVEMDDDFSAIHRDNIAYDQVHGRKDFGVHWLEDSANIADHVTISTPRLAKFARHGRYSVLRNCVPESIFDVDITKKSEVPGPRIGWSGSVQTHPNDLQATKGGVAEVLKEKGLDFNVIGDGKYVHRNLSLDKDTKVLHTGWVEIEHYYHFLSNFLDIGIVPLEMSPFNEAKSALKGLEFAALGIPYVASPTGEYARMEAYGIGKTAKTRGDWYKHLTRLIERSSETERIAREGRDKIKAEHTYRVNAPQWIEAWEKAIDYRKTRHEQAATDRSSG
ncbi:glycosyltransferase [Arthrobacter phage Mimi]|nr:glycosyltransferase [Arthrobacter phage Mimi]